jgi:hypothetical protein
VGDGASEGASRWMKAAILIGGCGA